MGVSHRSAPMALLERLALDADGVRRLGDALLRGESVDEVAVLATCNRLEVYVEAATFHGSVGHVGSAVAEVTGVDREELLEVFYVHYEDRAIAHVFSVACGLDAMAVGESQILGQMRDTLAHGQSAGWVGHQLNLLLQHALRVGKRAHSDTDLDRYSASLVETGLTAAEEHVGALADANVLVVGAGAMSSLVATTAARRGVAGLSVINRTPERTARLAAATGAQALSWESLEDALVEADVVFSCTGATGHVVSRDVVHDLATGRGGRPLAFVDLALPRDIDPDIDDLPGHLVLALEDLGRALAATAPAGGEALREVEDLVVAEVAAFLVTRRQEAVGPAVAALRKHAATVMRGELSRFDGRTPDLDDAVRAEVQRTVHRVVEKLLHTPTVRVKELAAGGHPTPGSDYGQMLRELFDLDAVEVAHVSRPPRRGGAGELE